MLTRKRINLPEYSGDARRDFDGLKRAIADYFLALEQKGALTITEARVDGTPIGSSDTDSVAATTVSASGQITSTVATGTAPLVIASTTKVSNLNVDQLDGADWAAPAAIGTGTPAAGTFTKVTVDDANFNLDVLTSNPTVTLDSTDYLEYSRAGNLLSFYVGGVGQWSAGADHFTFAGSGAVFDLNGVRKLTASQIQFPASQVASADANCLDDYEESETTPTPTSGTGTFTTVAGQVHATKVGNRVMFTARVQITTNGTAATDVRVQLPYSAAQVTGVCGANEGSGAALGAFVTGNSLRLFTVAGAYPGGSGVNLTASGSFRV